MRPLVAPSARPLLRPMAQVIGGYHAETQPILAKMTSLGSSPSPNEAHDIDALVGGAIQATIWTKLVAVQLYAAHSQLAALLDMKDLTRVVQIGASAPVFSSTGVLFDGVDDYVRTGLVPSAQTILTVTSNSLGAYSRTELSGSGNYGVIEAGSNRFSHNIRSATDTFSVSNVTANTSTGSSTTSKGFFSSERSGTAVSGYFNGALVGTIAPTVGTTRPTRECYIGAINNAGAAGSFDAREYAAFYAGQSLGAALQAQWNVLIQAYMTARLANV